VRDHTTQLDLSEGADAGFRFALEASPIALILVDAGGQIVLSNQRACVLFRIASLSGQSVDALLPSAHQAHHRTLRAQFLHAPARREMGTGRELRARRFDGTEFPVEVALNPFQHNGQMAVLCSVVDISERVRASHEREALLSRAMEEQRLESLGRLAGSIAHDFNNLLVGILGNASLAASLAPEGGRLRACIDDIERATQRASSLAQQMLACSGKGRFVVEDATLNQVIQHVDELLRASVPRTIQLQLQLADELPAIQADVSQIHQLVANLVANAADAIQDDGQIVIQTGAVHVEHRAPDPERASPPIAPGHYVFVEVRDDGCGMSPETQEKMFEPLFTTRPGRRGLGLTAIGGIVSGHSGFVRVRSEVGRGTTVRILFPAQSAPRLPEVTADASRGVIMVVDDNRDVQNLLQRLLSWEGFEVLQALDGVEAVELFEREQGRVQLILLDMVMPRMGGAEAFVELKKIRAQVPIVLSSGFSEEEVTVGAGQEPAGFLQKPYTASELVATIEAILEAVEPPGGGSPAHRV